MKPGTTHFVYRVDHVRAAGFIQLPRHDVGDDAVADAQGADLRGVAQAVEPQSVADDQVIAHDVSPLRS